MAFRLTPQEKKRRNELVSALRAVRSQLEDAINVYNTAVDEAKMTLEESVTKYNDALQEARGFCEDMANDWDNQIGEKSDKWREGERAQAAQQLVNDWSGVTLDDIDLDLPGDLSLDADDHAEVLEQLPEEADS